MNKSLLRFLLFSKISPISHGSAASFGRLSAFLENCSILPFCLSLFLVHSLILPHYVYYFSFCCCPKHNSRRRSLFMRVSWKEWPSTQLTGVYGMVRVPRHLDQALHRCPVLVKCPSVFDPTMILVVKLLESFIAAYWCLAQYLSIWFRKKPFISPSNGRQTHVERAPELVAIDCVQNPLITETESVRCSEKIAEVSSLQQHIHKAWADYCD